VRFYVETHPPGTYYGDVSWATARNTAPKAAHSAANIPQYTVGWRAGNLEEEEDRGERNAAGTRIPINADPS